MPRIFIKPDGTLIQSLFIDRAKIEGESHLDFLDRASAKTRLDAFPHVDLWQHITLAILCGFRGIGIYWNGKQLSFHLDKRSKPVIWTARKAITNGKVWKYKTVKIDPREV